MKKRNFRFIASLSLGLGLATCGWSQDNSQQTTSETQQTTKTKGKHVAKNAKPEPSPGRQVLNGTGNIAGGAGKGAGEAAKGVGKGAADLATLHPVGAAASVGKGAVVGGKDAGVGVAKGTGKVLKGVGRGIKHLF